jgi:acetyl-CoA carboxylase biotin carboxyl carrier protein
MILTQSDVQEIVKILEESPFDELKIETPRFKLLLSRVDGGWIEERRTETALGEKVRAEAATPKAPAAALPPGMVAIMPPLVGTFYRAPKPGAPPFVEVGSRVEQDTVVAIIETMKLMNSVRAGARGVIEEIRAENAEFVEEDRALMILRVEAR